MADVVITEFMDEASVDDLRSEFEVHYDPGLVDDRSALLEAVADARALIVRNRTIVDDEVLDAAGRLVVVGRLGVGLDNIDVAGCEARRVAVRPATGGNAVSVAEYVITAALVLRRGVYASTERVIAGEWPRAESVGRELAGARMGLVGYGRIAQEVATRAWALRMDVVAHDPFLPADAFGRTTNLSLDDVFSSSDVVSLHVPLDAGTRDLVDAARIDRMRDDAVIVNTSRGGIVDEEALADALREGRLGGAALDVFSDEPLSAGAAGRFAGVPNLLLTPHVAGVTVESNRRVSEITAAQVREALA
ncbi:MAG: hydroxyacid dehydrogenase [Acidimicrobiia bacterium]|nr:hydroxyacid dehydrogenase [Acidimicrobiia bacterium]